MKYFDLYGERFGYERYVRFRSHVIKVEPNSDYEETGKWVITVKDLTNGQIITDVVNGVMVCTGHHVQPLVPTFKDQDKFKGQIIHTHSYKRPDSFSDKKVIVVGIGNSGGDAAVELSTIAEKVCSVLSPIVAFLTIAAIFGAFPVFRTFVAIILFKTFVFRFIPLLFASAVSPIP